MKKLKIGARLLLGFGILMLALVLVGGFSTLTASHAARSLEGAMQAKQNEVLSLSVQKQIGDARTAVWNGIASDDRKAIALAAPALKNALVRLAELSAATFDPDRLALVAAVTADVETYNGKVAAVTALINEYADLRAAESLAAIAEATKAGDKVIVDIVPLGEAYSANAAKQAGEARGQLSSSVVVSLIVGAVSLLIGAALSFLISRSITLPIGSITAAMLILADGQLETVIPALDNKDEIGEMARSVEVFKRNMIEAERMRMAQAAEGQAKQRRAQVVDDLTKSFEETVGSIVVNVSSQAHELQMTAQSMASISQETSRQSNTVALSSGEALQNINTVAAATEELSASVGEILQQINRSTHLIGETVEQAGAANTEMQGLSSAMDRIGAVVDLIRGIASQTNLLALNATIEAARAGDAGKGFAVVASEVKLLANQTAKATEDISAQISSAQQATRSSVQSIKEITARIEGVSATSTAIASAVEEQGAATAEIARNVQEAARGSQEVAATISGVSNAAQESGAAASQVLSAAGSLSENSTVLRTQITDFLQSVRAA